MHKLILICTLLIVSPIAVSNQIDEVCENAAEYGYRGYDDAHFGIPFADRVKAMRNQFPSPQYQKLMISMMNYGRSLYPANPTMERHEVIQNAKGVCLEAVYK